MQPPTLLQKVDPLDMVRQTLDPNLTGNIWFLVPEMCHLDIENQAFQCSANQTAANTEEKNQCKILPHSQMKQNLFRIYDLI